MRRRRLLNTRFYRTRPKHRARLYRRMFGRLATARVAWRKWRSKSGAGFAVLVALLRSLTAKRTSNRFQLRKTPDHFVEPLKRGSRCAGIPWHRRMHTAFARQRLERYGLDVTGAPAEVATARQQLRNARKVERATS